MDGLETTALIRAREQGTGRHLPIVAMTAHAMKGDRERCLEAGMDGYLAKPVQGRELHAAIAAVLGEEVIAPPVAERRPGSSFDLEGSLDRLDGDERLLRQMARLFLKESAALLAEIRAAVEGRDADGLVKKAHKLKGSVSNFGAAACVRTTERLEAMARAGHLSGAPALADELEEALGRLQQELTDLVGKTMQAEVGGTS
jgi:CheY-like chemotaxis protein